MKLTFLAVLMMTLLPEDAGAITQAKFLGIFGMISLADRTMGQVQDNDPQDLFAKMNVPIKVQPQGQGKNIQTPGKLLTLTCAIRNAGEGNCTAVVKASEKAVISPGEGVIRYSESGAAAEELFKLFSSDGRLFRYETTAKDFFIEATAEKFVLEYRK